MYLKYIHLLLGDAFTLHCWKTINVKKQFGFGRIFLLSLLTGITVFSFAYVLLGIINRSTKSDDYFCLFALSFFGIYPLHKLFHFIPIFHQPNKVRFTVKKHLGFIPVMTLRIFEPIPKSRF